jgi:uncharacterized protein (PEP-CTERM system associated)
VGGHESNNFVSLDKKGHNISGLGVDWRPSERTTASASIERRFFGNSHSVVLEHRSPRSVWSFRDTRGVTTGFAQPTLGSRGTAFDLLLAHFASLQPDPALRAHLVDNFLQANGIPPTAVLFTGSLTSAVTLERRQELSFAMLGIRDTLMLAASQSEARRLDTVVAVSDDFANANNVRQRGLQLDWAHRLTSRSALNVLASLVKTTGTANVASTNLRTFALNWTSQVGARTNLSLGGRHISSSSSISPYTESALTATLSFRL